MKAVIAIDSFKGSLSSMEAGYAIAEGIKRTDAHAEVMVRPLAYLCCCDSGSDHNASVLPQIKHFIANKRSN